MAVLICAAAASLPAWCSGLKVQLLTTQTKKADSTALRIRVSWNDSWRNERNYDAAWVFLSYRKPGGLWRPALLRSAAGHEAVVDIPDDRAGAFLYPRAAHRGSVDWTLEVRVDPSSLTEVTTGEQVEWAVFGVEMVYIPEGAFWVGDRDPKAMEMNAFYRSDADGNPAGLLRIESEREIQVGAREGALLYKVTDPIYQGDGGGPVPEEFPKGFRAFYLMKYELTQGQYAEFLNHISTQATYFRAIHGGLDYKANRGTIDVKDGRFIAGAPARPANFVSWNDGIAFAAWARLRPMTEFEYTKASRGPGEPVNGDYPWGTASKAHLQRLIVAPNDDLITPGEATLTNATREVFGASYYWVMDLAGSVWERVVTPAAPVGRAFRGTHGNGRLTGFGSATNADWPQGDEAPGGYGYRGGGYYAHGFNAGELNPHSRTEWRRFGAWGQGPRSVAYGFRAARTAPILQTHVP
ncbi:MAG: SUMF1/EgtB/PvdO family nonheme iron enzyme [Bryobacteraceae bacterium]